MKRRTIATRTACAAKLAAASHPPAAPPPPVPKPALGNVDPNAGGYQFAWWWGGYHGQPVNFWGKLTGSIGNYEFTTTESPSSSMFQDGVPASRGNAHCQITGSDRGYLFNCIATFPDWIVPVYNPADPAHPKGKSPLMWQTKGEVVGCVQEKLTVRPPCNGLANGIGTTTDAGDKGIYILHIIPYAPGDTLNGPR
jgi:hypothetical protein